jgi:hypothetical protein
MKLLKEIKEILDKYYLGVDIPEEYKNVYRYEDDHPKKVEELFNHPELDDGTLYKKYENHIPKGWYGFSMGNPTPRNWFTAIDEILQLCIKNDSEFEIHQIKMKFGGIRFYCESDVIEDMWDIEILIGNKLHSKKLIY